jgi:hypothetical protein
MMLTDGRPWHILAYLTPTAVVLGFVALYGTGFVLFASVVTFGNAEEWRAAW